MYDATARRVHRLGGDRGPPAFHTDEGPDYMTEDLAGIERTVTERPGAVVVRRMDYPRRGGRRGRVGRTCAAMTDEERFAALRADRRGRT